MCHVLQLCRPRTTSIGARRCGTCTAPRTSPSGPSCSTARRWHAYMFGHVFHVQPSTASAGPLTHSNVMHAQDTTRFCLARSNRSRYSQAIHINTVGEFLSIAAASLGMHGFGHVRNELGGITTVVKTVVRDAGSKGSVRIRGMAVVQLPARVREGLQSMMKVSSLPLANLNARLHPAPRQRRPRQGGRRQRGAPPDEPRRQRQHRAAAGAAVRGGGGRARGGGVAGAGAAAAGARDSPMRPVRLHLDTARIAPSASLQVLCFVYVEMTTHT